MLGADGKDKDVIVHVTVIRAATQMIGSSPGIAEI